MKEDLIFLKGWREKRGGYYEVPNLLTYSLEDVSKRSGVYIICSIGINKFLYPGGKSRILYIGMSENLCQRLKEHERNLRAKLEDTEGTWFSDKYNYMAQYGAHVYCFECINQTPKNLEAFIMYQFYLRYGATPVGNGARSFRQPPMKQD